MSRTDNREGRSGSPVGLRWRQGVDGDVEPCDLLARIHDPNGGRGEHEHVVRADTARVHLR